MNEVILCAFGVYGVTLILSSYAGPYGIISRARAMLPVDLREGVTCFVCLSVWVGGVFALLAELNFLEYLAVVGAAILAEEFRG